MVANLKRKATNESSNENDTAKKKPAARRKAACLTCRLRKVKCDQARPKCGFCTLNDDECVFENGHEPEKHDPKTRVLVDRLDRVLDGVDHLASLIQRPENISRLKSSHGLREPAKDYLKIPTGRACADTVLTWPIFDQIFPSQSLITSFYQPDKTSCANLMSGSLVDSYHFGSQTDCLDVVGGLLPLPDDQIPGLVDRFLQNVHTKNPILDVDALIKAARLVPEQGLGWDATSCLILLACALGAVSEPFNKCLALMGTWHLPNSASNIAMSRSSNTLGGDLRLAESCFIMACRRLGTLKFTVLGAQCHFFAAVYLMYTIRPLEAWNHFYQSSTFYQFFLKSVGGPSSDDPEVNDWYHLHRITRVQRRLEQSLYWSCFKSEVEMRVELPLVQSDISNFEYPDPFPSPPTPIPTHSTTLPESTCASSLRQTVDATYSSSIRQLRGSDNSTSPTEDTELRRHSRALYNEEESWYYYLTEVALRRISNRIINTFFKAPAEAWMHIQDWIPVALELDDQISSWSANLPASMQSFQISSTGVDYTAPISFTVNDMNDTDSIRSSVSKEMSWCIENRILEMRSWLYQPFLYYIIHKSKSQENITQNISINSEQSTAVDELVRAGIDCNIKTLEWRTLPHRHHGIWFDLRSVITAIIILNALARTNPSIIPRWLFEDDTTTTTSTPETASQNGQRTAVTFNVALDRLRFWEEEAPDLRAAIKILEIMVRETKHLLQDLGPRS